MSYRRLLYSITFLLIFVSQVLPADVQTIRPVTIQPRKARMVATLEEPYHVQVQFYRSSESVYSVHGPYPFVRERFEGGVRTLYYASSGGGETALATMSSPDGWEIIGDPSGLWDILTVVPNES